MRPPRYGAAVILPLALPLILQYSVLTSEQTCLRCTVDFRFCWNFHGTKFYKACTLETLRLSHCHLHDRSRRHKLRWATPTRFWSSSSTCTPSTTSNFGLNLKTLLFGKPKRSVFYVVICRKIMIIFLAKLGFSEYPCPDSIPSHIPAGNPLQMLRCKYPA